MGKLQKYYKVTSICKADMRHVFRDNRETLKQITALTDGEMERIAGKMADDYINQLYWDHLKHFTEVMLEDKEKREVT